MKRFTGNILIVLGLLAILLPPAPARGGAAKIDERTVTGRGEDARAAILNGLIEAIQQVNGVKIEHKSVVYRQYSDVIEDLKESFKSSVVSSGEIKSASRGYIDSYDVMSETPGPGGTFECQLRVRVAVYDPAAPIRAGQRKVIAVIPFRTVQGDFDLFGQHLPAGELTRLLSQATVNHLVQCRKFTVLDREFLSELYGEKKFIEMSNMPVAELVKIGQQLGADFLLVGTVDDASAGSRRKEVKLTGRVVELRDARIALGYRVLNVATGKVHWSNNVRVGYGNDDFKNFPPERANLRVEELLTEDAAFDMSTQVIDGVYPLKIIKLDGDQLVLNQGESRAHPGEELEVYASGGDVVDPDTGETLAIDRRVARLRVQRVTPKVSYAKVLEGDVSKITVGSVCRRSTEAPPRDAD